VGPNAEIRLTAAICSLNVLKCKAKDSSTHAKATASRLMGTIGQRKVAVDIDPVVQEQLIYVDQRRTWLSFRHHLGTTGMMGPNDLFRFVGLFLKGIDFLE